MCSLRLTGVKRGRLAYLPDGVGRIAPVETLQIDGLGPELPSNDPALPAAIEAPPDGLLKGKGQPERHRGRVDWPYLKASRGFPVLEYYYNS